MQPRTLITLMGGAAASAVLWHTPALAQSASDVELGEVVITALRREETLSKVPLSVTALTTEAMDRQGIRDMDDVVRVTPGLQLTSVGPFGGTSVSIRGIFSEVGAQTTGVYINDVPVAQRNGLGALAVYSNLFDVERVEVLRGPQGTLYGAGSEGGTIRFLLRQPSVTQASTYGRAELANTRKGDETYEMGVATGGPILQDRLGFRASVWGRREGGWIDRIQNLDLPGSTGQRTDRDTNRMDQLSGRLAVTWAPTDRLTITPDAFIQRSWKRDTDLSWERAGRAKQEMPQDASMETRSKIFSNTVDYSFDAFTARWVASYSDIRTGNYAEESYFDVTSLTGGLLIVPGFEDFRAVLESRRKLTFATQELRFTSNDDEDTRLSWVAGLFWQRNKASSRSPEFEPQFNDLITELFGAGVEDIFGAPMLGDVSYLSQDWSLERQLAAYADLTYRFTDRLSVTAGLRVAKTRFAFDSYQDGPWNGGPSFGQGASNETPVTPKINVSYELDRGLIYATAAKGYRIGGANASLGGNLACRAEINDVLGLDDVPASYKSDSVISYEGGYKNRFGPLTVAASAFWVDWKDIQANVPLECFWSYTANLGKAVSRGGDISLRYQPARGLLLGADVGYTDAHYSETYRLGDTAILALKGDPLPTPSVQAAFSAQYTRPVGDWEAYLRGDVSYSSRYRRGVSDGVIGDDPPTRYIPSLTLVNARLGAVRGSLDMSMFVNNLTDEDTPTFFYHYTGLDSVRLANTPRPRTIGVTLTAAFD
jgi:iron complex outermembrane receptor protein